MEKLKKTGLSIIVAAVFVLLFLFSVIDGQIIYAKAEPETIYSNVLDDLKKDSSFDPQYYPEKANDYSLQLIQIAESADKELFVYVYQPNAKQFVHAGYIRFSINPQEDISPKDYSLTYLNSDGVFFKYKVNGFTVDSADIRYYAVIQLMRPWLDGVDIVPPLGNKVSYVPYSVEKYYTFFTFNGQVFIKEEHLDVIVVTSKFCGFCRYPDGGFSFTITSGACDAHFVAFNTDRRIDDLIEAEVVYSSQSVHEMISLVPGVDSKVIYGEIEEQPELLVERGTVEYEGKGWFTNKYSWDRIQTVDEFIEMESRHDVYKGVLFDKTVDTSLKLDIEEELRDKYAWVLRFTETEYDLMSTEYTVDELYTNISDVTILRLKFVTAGTTYNLGVVDNYQSGSGEPVNTVDESWSFNWERLISLIALIILIFLIIVFIGPISSLLSFLLKVILWVIKAVLWLLTLPFRLISSLINKRNPPKK